MSEESTGGRAPGAVAVIADAHLGGPEAPGDGAKIFVAQLEEIAASGCHHLVLLGDIFHVWIGDPKFETPEVAAVMPKLRELRRRGVRIDYVEGNRDFFLRDSAYQDAFDLLALESAFEAGGKRYLAVHGDGLNDRDWKYCFWRWLSKSPPVRLAIWALPRPWARKLVTGTEGRLSKSNFKHKAEVPEGPIRAYGQRRLAGAPHEILLLGHFHEPHTWPVEGGEIRLLDAWFRSPRILWLGNDP